jgi:DNA-binding NarL/FixJ family response regulator
VDTTNVLLVDMPRMARETLASILTTQPSLAVLTVSTSDPAGVRAILDRTEVDVVIVSANELKHSELPFLLFESRPCPRVLVIAGDGRETIRCEPLGELSPSGLLDAVRSPLMRH